MGDKDEERADECYAAALGDCDGLSEEHYISRAVLATSGDSAQPPVKRVPISGLPEQLDGAIETKHIDHLTAPVLCRKHNNELSPVDQAGADLMRALKAAGANQPGTFIVDGARLERWFLKCLMGTVAADLARDKDAGSLRMPRYATAWLRILYGLQPMPVRAGMYARAIVGQTHNIAGGGLSFAPIGRPAPWGALFEFRTLSFVFNAQVSGATPTGDVIDGAIYRPAVFQFLDQHKAPITRIELKWINAMGNFGTIEISYKPPTNS